MYYSLCPAQRSLRSLTVNEKDPARFSKVVSLLNALSNTNQPRFEAVIPYWLSTGVIWAACSIPDFSPKIRGNPSRMVLGTYRWSMKWPHIPKKFLPSSDCHPSKLIEIRLLAVMIASRIVCCSFSKAVMIHDRDVFGELRSALAASMLHSAISWWKHLLTLCRSVILSQTTHSMNAALNSGAGNREAKTNDVVDLGVAAVLLLKDPNILVRAGKGPALLIR